MQKEDFDKYLTERYQQQTDWYDDKARTSQKSYRRMQWSIIVLAALTPVLIELELHTIGPWYGHIPTLTAATVAILTAGLKTFNYQENWLNYRSTCEALHKEQHYYKATVGEYAGQDEDQKRALFVMRVESLMSRENTIWLNTQQTEKKQDDNENPPTTPDPKFKKQR